MLVARASSSVRMITTKKERLDDAQNTRATGCGQSAVLRSQLAAACTSHQVSESKIMKVAHRRALAHLSIQNASQKEAAAPKEKQKQMIDGGGRCAIGSGANAISRREATIVGSRRV